MQSRRGEVTAEMLQVLHLRAAPAINRLIVVADREWGAVRAHEEFHPPVLDGVRVLELVDEHVAEASLIVREQLRLSAPQLEGAQQELCEIDDARLRAGGLVAGIEFDELAAVQVARIFKLSRAAAFVLVGIDEPLDLARHPAGFIQVLGFQNLADEAQLILGVEDLKALRQIGLAPVQAQEPMRDAMERADPQRGAGRAEELCDAATHLPCRLVREGDGEDALRGYALDLNQPRDPMREHAGLAAAGAGEHQYRPERGRDRGALCVVERIEEGRDIHGGRIVAASRGFQGQMGSWSLCSTPSSAKRSNATMRLKSTGPSTSPMRPKARTPPITPTNTVSVETAACCLVR